MYIYIYMYICACVCVYTHKYTYTYVSTYIHMYIYIHINTMHEITRIRQKAKNSGQRSIFKFAGEFTMSSVGVVFQP